MTDTTQQWWENEAWKQLKRVKELEDENALLRHRLKAIGREADVGEVKITVERFMGRTWYSLDPEPSSDLQDTQTAERWERFGAINPEDCAACTHPFDRHDVSGCEICDRCVHTNQRRNRHLG